MFIYFQLFTKYIIVSLPLIQELAILVLNLCFKMSGGEKKKQMPTRKKEGDGDAGCKRGSSHKGGDLNSWKESDMQNAWDEYTE